MLSYKHNGLRQHLKQEKEVNVCTEAIVCTFAWISQFFQISQLVRYTLTHTHTSFLDRTRFCNSQKTVGACLNADIHKHKRFEKNCNFPLYAC